MKCSNVVPLSIIPLTLLILSEILLFSCSGETPSKLSRDNRMQNSPQFKDGKFVNPVEAPVMAEGSTWKYVKKAYFSKRIDPVPSGELPVKPVLAEDWVTADAENVSFAWLGHSSLLIAMDGKTILVDPVLEKRASPFSWVGPRRFHRAPVSARDLPAIDVVLITHDHYDHLEKPTIKQLAGEAGLFLVPLGIGNLLVDWGLAAEKVVELDWWEHRVVGPLVLTATPGIHYARRGLFDGDKRLWCSWSVAGQRSRIFISGDSGYFDGFEKIGEKLGPFDLTFLKIGSYDDMWKQIHMLPEEAVQQHLDLKGVIMVPLHWASFDLALHPWYEPIERSLAAAEIAGVRIATPLIGERVELDHMAVSSPWWRGVDEK